MTGVTAAAGSYAPIAGGAGRVVPAKSLMGAPVAVPAALAGDVLVICRFVGASTNNGFEVSELVPVVSAVPPAAPLITLPKNRLLVMVAPLALSAPAEVTPAVEPEPPKE